MPNLPLMVGMGATALATDGLDSDDLDACRSLLKSAGRLVEVGESQLDAVTGLSGSGPAYVIRFLQALEDGGVMAVLRDQSRGNLRWPLWRGLRLLEVSGLDPMRFEDKYTPAGTPIYGSRRWKIVVLCCGNGCGSIATRRS
jgi:pyrroline-5-carboxylate reductase